MGNVIRSAQKLYVTAASASKALDLVGDAKLEYAANGGEMTTSVRGKIFGTVILSGMAAISGRSLTKDVGRFAKAASETMPRFKTAVKEKAEDLKNWIAKGLGTSGSGHMSRNRGFAVLPFGGCENSITKPDFLVTQEGVVLPTNKDFNLVSTTQPTNEGGEYLQIHNIKPHHGLSNPHTHKPQINVDLRTGKSNSIRLVNDTTATDINYADEALRKGKLRIRTNRRDTGGY